VARAEPKIFKGKVSPKSQRVWETEKAFWEHGILAGTFKILTSTGPSHKLERSLSLGFLLLPPFRFPCSSSLHVGNSASYAESSCSCSCGYRCQHQRHPLPSPACRELHWPSTSFRSLPHLLFFHGKYRFWLQQRQQQQ